MSEQSQPLVFAHRGSSVVEPEHTLAAYLQAIKEGVDGLECDVRLSRDAHLICIHDRRLDRTSNGRGRVSRVTLDQLKDLDFGGHPVLTLETLLITALASGTRLRLLIETKHPSRYGAQVESRLADLLGRYGLVGPRPRDGVSVTVMSFSPTALRRMRRLAPAVPTVFLFDVAAVPGVRTGSAPFGASILGPGIGTLRARPELVARAHGRGHQVYVWTVNTPADMELAVQLGVDGIISDRPADVLRQVGR